MWLKEHHSKVLLNSFPMNGHTLGFCTWSPKLDNFFYHPRFHSGIQKVKQQSGWKFSEETSNDLACTKHRSVYGSHIFTAEKKNSIWTDLGIALKVMQYTDVFQCFSKWSFVTKNGRLAARVTCDNEKKAFFDSQTTVFAPVVWQSKAHSNNYSCRSEDGVFHRHILASWTITRLPKPMFTYPLVPSEQLSVLPVLGPSFHPSTFAYLPFHPGNKNDVKCDFVMINIKTQILLLFSYISYGSWEKYCVTIKWIH